MFSKIIVFAFLISASAAACASQVTEYELAMAEARAEFERDAAQALALARIRVKAMDSPGGCRDFSGAVLALMACTVFLAANAAQVVLARFGMGMTRRNFGLFMVLTVLYLNVTVAESFNASEIESDIDALYAKFQAKWDQESADIAAMELELVEASADLERVRQLEVYAIENQLENLLQWPDAHDAWPVSVAIAQLVVGASVALVVVRWFVRVLGVIVQVVYYFLVGLFCVLNSGLIIFMIYLIFYHEQEPY